MNLNLITTENYKITMNFLYISCCLLLAHNSAMCEGAVPHQEHTTDLLSSSYLERQQRSLEVYLSSHGYTPIIQHHVFLLAGAMSAMMFVMIEARIKRIVKTPMKVPAILTALKKMTRLYAVVFCILGFICYLIIPPVHLKRTTVWEDAETFSWYLIMFLICALTMLYPIVYSR